MLWEARVAGASFERTLLIGRQTLKLHPAELRYFQSEFRRAFPDVRETPLAGYRFSDYADEFFRAFLGAKHLSVLDYSDFEGADILHDLNEPVPESLAGAFDAVVDGGSLEHVFNFPVAAANVMRLVRPGGRAFLFVPANNLCGHGFYQFSPELMYRVFSPENGFEAERVNLWEASYPSVERAPHGRAWSVEDPARVRDRVGLLGDRALTLQVQARKAREVVPFARPPLQSDYVARWEADSTGATRGRGPLKRLLAPLWSLLPSGLRARIQGAREKRRHSFANRRFFRPLP